MTQHNQQFILKCTVGQKNLFLPRIAYCRDNHPLRLSGTRSMKYSVKLTQALSNNLKLRKLRAFPIIPRIIFVASNPLITIWAYESHPSFNEIRIWNAAIKPPDVMLILVYDIFFCYYCAHHKSLSILKMCWPYANFNHIINDDRHVYQLSKLQIIFLWHFFFELIPICFHFTFFYYYWKIKIILKSKLLESYRLFFFHQIVF